MRISYGICSGFPTLVVLIISLIIGLQIAPITQGQFTDYWLVIRQLEWSGTYSIPAGPSGGSLSSGSPDNGNWPFWPGKPG